MLWFLLLLLPGDLDPRIDRIRNDYLDLSRRETVAQAFEAYPWFETHQWQLTEAEDGAHITFQGWMPNQKAVDDFNRVHRFQYDNLKSMRLDTHYGIDGNQDMLYFKVDFLLAADGSFRVTGGSIGVRAAGQQDYGERPLPDKALVTVIKGFYADRNPFMSLIRGMPYK